MDDATIYLEDQRGCSQNNDFQCLHTFNFGQYFDPNRQPFGNLRVFNDVKLKAQQSISRSVETNTDVLILPLEGGLAYQTGAAEEQFVVAGQVLHLALGSNESYRISNPYQAEIINYLEIWVTDNTPSFAAGSRATDFDLGQKNTLLPLLSLPNFGAYIGQFCTVQRHHRLERWCRYGGREEETYSPQNPKNSLFAFVIAGAFEFQNRLLHARDGLALEQAENIDFEALSNDAVVLLLEM